MTKQYDIISLNNHLYMVDKEALKVEDWVIVGNITASNHRVEKLTSEILESAQKLQELMNSDKFPAKEKVKNVRILASTDTTLGLSLLPKVEEDVQQPDYMDLAEKAWGKMYPYFDYNKLVEFGKLVFKAASVKKYTEEDIMKWYKYVKTHTCEEAFEYLNKSLTPKPKQVEVEIEEIPIERNYEDPESYDSIEIKPKTKDNIVVVKRWIYE